LAYSVTLRTRLERAEIVRSDKKDFFDRYGPEARAIIKELLDKYAEHGTAQFAVPNVFEVPPISRHGNLKEIAAKYGGTDKLLETLSRLQRLLYAA
jgi:type I restriction enzyme R subunit